jgi:TorA maturation chaperone TorD
MSIDIFAAKSQSAETRSQCYSFLSYVHMPLPGSDFIPKIMDNSIYRVFRSSAGDVTISPDEKEHLEQGLTMVENFLIQACDVAEDDLVQSLAVERARLFRGIKRDYGPPPPYGSVYIEGDSVMNTSTLQVRKAYASFEYNLSEDCRELPDYISVELDFMRHLCNEEAAAWTGENENRAQACLTGETEFLCGHLREWAPQFCDEVIRCADQDFYQAMARITKGFLMIDAQRLSSRKAGEAKNG